VSESQSSIITELFSFNGCLSVIDCWLLCEFENFAATSDAIKRFFLRILNTNFTNSLPMVITVTVAVCRVWWVSMSQREMYPKFLRVWWRQWLQRLRLLGWTQLRWASTSLYLLVTERAMSLEPRNSAVADKPRDAFVLIQWRGWPPHYVLQCRFWSFCVKGCMHKYRCTPKKLWSPETLLSWDWRRVWPEIHDPPRHVSPRHIW